MSDTIDLDFTFGMPPHGHITDPMIENTMPIAYIKPMEPNFTLGLTTFSLTNAWSKYKKILLDHGFTTTASSLKCAFLADNFPTDTFSNEYGESFLDKFAQAASSGVQDISAMFGVKTVKDIPGKLEGVLGKDSAIAGMAGKGVSMFEDMAKKLEGDGSGPMKGIGDAAMAIAAGSRVDFPTVWKNSSHSPSYTMTVRLYNPNPGSAKSTKKYIAGPLAALLICSMPQQSDGTSMYQWPFLCEIHAPGIYRIPSAYVQSVSVIKGGDQQNIAWNQNLSIVDVRIEFGSLFNSMLVETDGAQNNSSRPTLKKYLSTITGEDAEGKRKYVKNIYKVPDMINVNDQLESQQKSQDEYMADNSKKVKETTNLVSKSSGNASDATESRAPTHLRRLTNNLA